jgi:hypothetical protein
MLFASRSEINSIRFRRSLASAPRNVTAPPSAFPCAFSSPCAHEQSIGSTAVAPPRSAWACDLSTGFAASIPGTFCLKPNVIERQPAWSVLGADPLAVPALPQAPDGPDSAASRGPLVRQKSHRGSGSIRTLVHRGCQAPATQFARSNRGSPLRPS